MDTKNRLFFWIFGLLILGSVTAAFLKYFIFLNYTVQAEIDCDPETENCYVYICNPKEEECTGDLEEDTWYYKVINKKAYAFPNCDPNEDENCVIDCAIDEEGCEVDLCDPNDPESGQECMTPEKYELLSKAAGDEEEGSDVSGAEADAEDSSGVADDATEPREVADIVDEEAGDLPADSSDGQSPGGGAVPVENGSAVVPN